MVSALQPVTIRERPSRSIPPARKIELLLDWAEPTIRQVCQEIWRQTKPRGLEIADLHQEGRIAVFEAAERILSARNPRGLVVAVIRRRVLNGLRVLALDDGHSPGDFSRTDGEEAVASVDDDSSGA